MEDERAEGPEELEDGEELPRNAVLWTGRDGCAHEHSSYGYLHAMNPARWADVPAAARTGFNRFTKTNGEGEEGEGDMLGVGGRGRAGGIQSRCILCTNTACRQMSYICLRM